MGNDNNGNARGTSCWCDHCIMTLGWWQSVPEWQSGCRQKERDWEIRACPDLATMWAHWLPCYLYDYKNSRFRNQRTARTESSHMLLPSIVAKSEYNTKTGELLWKAVWKPAVFLSQLLENLEMHQSVRLAFSWAFDIYTTWENTNTVWNMLLLVCLQFSTSSVS